MNNKIYISNDHYRLEPFSRAQSTPPRTLKDIQFGLVSSLKPLVGRLSPYLPYLYAQSRELSAASHPRSEVRLCPPSTLRIQTTRGDRGIASPPCACHQPPGRPRGRGMLNSRTNGLDGIPLRSNTRILLRQPTIRYSCQNVNDAISVSEVAHNSRLSSSREAEDKSVPRAQEYRDHKNLTQRRCR